MKEIILSNGMKSLVDDHDFKFLNEFNYFALVRKTTCYARMVYRNKYIFIHWLIIGKPIKGFVVDHINGNGLDNRRNNLRIATYRQNQINRRHTKNTSGFRGVFKMGKRFVVQIKMNNKTIYGGMYDDKKEAAKRYDELAKKIHGDFAITNF